MIAFIIPIKSKTISSDWTNFLRLLNRCLNSVCNQSNTNFKVYIACHEIPETKFKDHPKVEFLQVDFLPPILEHKPSDRWLKEADKGKKLKVAAKYAEKSGASYIMTVDADDCISSKICEFIEKNENNNIPGWYMKKGYLYTEGKKYAYLNLQNFNTVCGTCIIIKPDLINLMYRENNWFNHKITNLNDGLNLLPFTFPGTLYSMLNLSLIHI